MEKKTKICVRCKKRRSLKLFYKRTISKDGLSRWCKFCNKKLYHSTTSDPKRSKEWREKNPNYRKEYGIANIERIRETRRKYYHKRKQEPLYKLEICLRNRLYGAIVYNKGLKKSDKTVNLIGCSIRKCKEHLESLFTEGMSWSNQGEWHIDHIIPIESFNLKDPNQQKICFNYINLQPLWGEENLQKSCKINWKKVAE